MITHTLISFLLVLILFTLGFVIARIKNDISIVDIFWGLGFVVVAWYTLLIGGPMWDRNILIVTLVTIWGVRLAWHILFRSIGKKEDRRYTEMRKGWNNIWLSAYVRVFLLQAVLVIIVSAPIIWVNLRWAPETTGLDLIGLGVWCIGFFFEVVGDAQLSAYLKKKKRKKILTTGLRKYSRYPNYFGEIAMWWGIWIISISSGAIYTIISPILVTILLKYVSGVPLLDKKFMKKPGYKKYAERTNPLFPWPPKK